MITEQREKNLIWTYYYSDRIVAFFQGRVCWSSESRDRFAEFQKWEQAMNAEGLSVVRGN